MKARVQKHRYKPGQHHSFIPKFDVLLSQRCIHVIVDKKKKLIVAIVVPPGVAGLSPRTTSLEQANAYANDAANLLGPETIMKKSMGPVDVTKYKEVNAKVINKVMEETGLTVLCPSPKSSHSHSYFLQMEKVLHIHPTGRGIYIGTEVDKTSDGKLKIEEKNYFRNEGHPQYVGGPKLGQNYGGRKTAKISVLSQVRDKLKEERLFGLHTDMQHLYEQLGTPFLAFMWRWHSAAFFSPYQL